PQNCVVYALALYLWRARVTIYLLLKRWPTPSMSTDDAAWIVGLPEARPSACMKLLASLSRADWAILSASDCVKMGVSTIVCLPGIECAEFAVLPPVRPLSVRLAIAPDGRVAWP